MRLQAPYKLMQFGELSKYTSTYHPSTQNYVKLTQWKNYMYTYVNGIEQPKKSAFQSQMISIATTHHIIVIYQILHRTGGSSLKGPTLEYSLHNEPDHLANSITAGEEKAGQGQHYLHRAYWASEKRGALETGGNEQRLSPNMSVFGVFNLVRSTRSPPV